MEDVIICRCEGIRLSEMLASIREGASAVPGVKKRNRAGMGYCQGRVCQRVINELIESETGQPTSTLQRAQSPVRPIALRDI
ncbi:(2Fe-2S)-binding protein [Brevibacillus choshinensis]|uniref:(2Fe-2S)-binding protein n=1 Tax=Brevibacillus choshinensis TaxID=54911 RepID=UPI002E2041D2|nr:(2Fe-2S)-binding protein [Brevibacillus choshinensis]MED4753077.1 (2Fe-2S)-binding protein [Brevibacillus choshinensis]MED4781346.1 (2Fe-2S)-binding protein [Brevibacillus choshinensis]